MIVRPARRQLSISSLAAFAQDLQLSYNTFSPKNGVASTELVLALDANVMWFYQRSLETQNDDTSNYISEAIGSENSANLIRLSLGLISSEGNDFKMTEAHKYEIDVGIAQELSISYTELRNRANVAAEKLVEMYTNTVNSTDLLKDVVGRFKDKFPDDFRVLTDILGNVPQHYRDIAAKTKTIRAPKIDLNDNRLERTLDKVRFILDEIYERPKFSIAQDIKALRDIALLNSDKSRRGTVLLTFDKRLLQAIRLVQAWGEPDAELLRAESAQTFWIWHLTGPDFIRHPAVSAVRAVLDDFRLKIPGLFSGLDEGKPDAHPVWIVNANVVKAACDRIARDGVARMRSDTLFYVEVIAQLRYSLSKQDEWLPVFLSSNSSGMLQRICGQFFSEVEMMIPSFRLILSNLLDREKVLETTLIRFGHSESSFKGAVGEEIEAHAKASLDVLGASTLVAPRTIRAAHDFLKNAANASYVHRMPLPIANQDVSVNQVVALVTSNPAKLEARYDELMNILSYRGGIADLIAAYLLACGGAWLEAENTCRAYFSRGTLRGVEEQISDEMRILFASILRIYNTNSEKLAEAQYTLDGTSSENESRSKSDQLDVKIDLERLAIKLNKILFLKYKSVIAMPATVDSTDGVIVDALCHSLLELRHKLLTKRDLSTFLRDKVLANISVNICLAVNFVGVNDAYFLTWETVYQDILRAAVKRVSERAVRISFFEEIIISFCAVAGKSAHRERYSDTSDLVSILNTRLSRVLRRDEKANEFEYWMYRSIRRRLNEVGL